MPSILWFTTVCETFSCFAWLVGGDFSGPVWEPGPSRIFGRFLPKNPHQQGRNRSAVRPAARNKALKGLFGYDESVLGLYGATKNPWARRTPGWCTLDTFLMSTSLFCSLLFQEVFTGNTDFTAQTDCCGGNRQTDTRYRIICFILYLKVPC